MSRCFPYPPPGYVRNPVAAAEAQATTKLQKEREKAEKKKEKRSDRKALKQAEGSKHSKQTHKKRKHGDISEAVQESQKVSKEPVEQLEKSGLSEEQGAPCFVQTVHGSPESSQDSSKRRKVVLPSPSQAKNGNIIRIKIRRDQDSSEVLEKSKVEQPPVKQMGSSSSLLSKRNSIQPHNNKVVNKSASAGQQSIMSDSQAVLKQVIQSPAKVMQRVDLLTTAKVTQQKDVPSSSMKAPIGRLGCPPAEMISVGPSPTKVMGRVDPPPAKVTHRVDPLPTKALQRVDPLLLSKVRMNATPLSTKVFQKETKPEGSNGRLGCRPPAEMIHVGPSPTKVMGKVDPPPANVTHRVNPLPTKALQRVDPLLLSKVRMDATPLSTGVFQKETKPEGVPLPQNTKVPVGMPTIKEQQTNSAQSKEEASFSGRNTEAISKTLGKQSKSEQRERKFEDLFVTWDPPSFEMEDMMDLGDQDWLFGSRSKPDAGTSNCKVAEAVPSQLAEQCSLQPKAIYSPDLHVYQLPYVVPF
ncbi:hypothetical protein ABZP36_005907 [Zizania latifolia]